MNPINEITDEFGEYHHLMLQLRQDGKKIKEYFIMNRATFDYLKLSLTICYKYNSYRCV